MAKYVKIDLSNNIHRSPDDYDGSVFHDCVYVKKTEKKLTKYYFGHTIMIKK